MSRERFISLLLAATLAIAAALYFNTQRTAPRDPRGKVFLPFLAADMDSVSSLSIRKGSVTPTVTLQKHAQQWNVVQRGDYPADVVKLRKLLLALNDAKIVEEKTSNPASFSIIGVEDPAAAGASGSEIDLVAKDGPHAVIVGKPVGNGSFARRGGENQSYSVEPAIAFEAEPRFWIDVHLIDIATTSIQRIEVKPGVGPGYSIHRSSPTDASFVLDGVPPGRKAVDAAALAPSPTTYSGLTAEDVTAASKIDFSKPSVATVTLTDGSVISLSGVISGDKRWIQIKMSQPGPFDSQAAGRAFEVTGFRYDAIFRSLDQLLIAKPDATPLARKKTQPASRP